MNRTSERHMQRGKENRRIWRKKRRKLLINVDVGRKYLRLGDKAILVIGAALG